MSQGGDRRATRLRGLRGTYRDRIPNAVTAVNLLLRKRWLPRPANLVYATPSRRQCLRRGDDILKHRSCPDAVTGCREKSGRFRSAARKSPGDLAHRCGFFGSPFQPPAQINGLATRISGPSIKVRGRVGWHPVCVEAGMRFVPAFLLVADRTGGVTAGGVSRLAARRDARQLPPLHSEVSESAERLPDRGRKAIERIPACTASARVQTGVAPQDRSEVA